MGIVRRFRESALLTGAKIKARSRLESGVEFTNLPPDFDREECAYLCAQAGFNVYQAINQMSPKEYPAEEVLVSVGFAALTGYPEYEETTRVALYHASELFEIIANVNGELSEHMLSSARQMREKLAGDSARKVLAEARENLDPDFDLSSLFDDLEPK